MTQQTARHGAALVIMMAAIASTVRADELPGAVRFRDAVQPILADRCYGCHGYGSSEGGRTLDEFESDEALVGNVDLWWAVLKNVRAGLMPPAGEERPTDDERERLFLWIQSDVFRIDPQHPDPGRVTLRRLNRVEYRNTIQDLMGVDYNTTEEFPPDDTGYGFDTIGDVLSLSPLLLEKYVQAAERIVREAVPTVSKVVASRQFGAWEFRSDDGRTDAGQTSFYDQKHVAHTVPVEHAGDYRFVIEGRIRGGFDFDPGRCEVTYSLDGDELLRQVYPWHDNKTFSHEVTHQLSAGEHRLAIDVRPLVPVVQKQHELNLHLNRVRLEGPLDEAHWVPPPNHARFFPDGPPPDNPAARDAYARTVLDQFASRAFRRPLDEQTLERLVAVAQDAYHEPETTFEAGVGRAMAIVLASPRFLFRFEQLAPTAPDEPYPLMDEYALASRLSYFLWSTMPDDKLWELARRGELRANLAAQVERMMRHRKSRQLVENFVGQWLQSRDVEHASIDPASVLGHRGEWEMLVSEIQELRRRSDQRRRGRGERSPEVQRLRERLNELRRIEEQFGPDLWRAMRQETESTFGYVMREDRSLLELLDSDYTFLNGRLAEPYGIPGVEGPRMRRVELPADSPRGGILTQATMLVVTSNPTRTSPVKRGLFVLDNILGMPPPPPPADVPELEAAAAAIKGHEPTLRELLELHRQEPLCHSCHSRMDPLGLALENFNALGQWRDTEHGQPIDPTGELITGEEFQNLRELKQILVEQHRRDFYRCLSEKMLTYALGRGLEYHDEHTVDQIVARLDRADGRFSELLAGIVESPPFQRQRRHEPAVVEDDGNADELDHNNEGLQVGSTSQESVR